MEVAVIGWGLFGLLCAACKLWDMKETRRTREAFEEAMKDLD